MSSQFFTSRWVQRPSFVRELEGHLLPQGFRAAGVPCGIKPSGKPDLALVYSLAKETTSAARFTSSSTAAPPVELCRESCALDQLRAVVINAGNANAATGIEGKRNAWEMQQQVAGALGVDDQYVGVASTGVIGVQLDMSCVRNGIGTAVEQLAPDNATNFVQAICTTDLFEKYATVEVELPDGTVRLAAQAKGAGMINPAFATMICVIETDAKLSADLCERLLVGCEIGEDGEPDHHHHGALKRSFEAISVDRQLSTNDAVFLLASGESGVEIAAGSESEQRFAQAFQALLRQLALLIARDGEGAKRVGRVVVRGGDSDDCQRAAFEVANSPLVKAALHGGDPNWGRIVQAVGMALPQHAPLQVDIAIEGVSVCLATTAVPHDAAALSQAVAGDEVEYQIQLPGDGCEAELFFSDLSHEYVTINSQYTT